MPNSDHHDAFRRKTWTAVHALARLSDLKEDGWRHEVRVLQGQLTKVIDGGALRAGVDPALASWAEPIWKAMRDTGVDRAEMVPLRWVRWAVSALSGEQRSRLMAAFANWWSSLAGEGTIPMVKRRVSTKSPLTPATMSVHEFVLRPFKADDMTRAVVVALGVHVSQMESKLVKMQDASRSVLKSGSVARVRVRGTGAESAVWCALQALAVKDDHLEMLRVMGPYGQFYTAEKTYNRKEIYDLIRTDKDVQRYSVETVLPIISDKVICRKGRPSK